ncbi:unnamed protein product [Absidia cylindrospora]
MVVSPYALNPLLRDTFSQVTCVKNAKEALLLLQRDQQQHGHTKPTKTTESTGTNTLLLIDMENDHRNIVSLKMLVYHLRQGTVINFVPLVCSSNDSSDYMLSCIDHGAADYLLKPLRHNVVQTMFLAAHRYPPSQQLLPSPTSSSSTSSGPSESELLVRSGPKCNQTKQIFTHHDWIYQAVLDSSSSKRQRNIFELHKLSSDHKLELEKRLGEWGFCPFDLSDTDLVYCVSWIFDQAFLLPELACFKGSSVDFIHDLWSGYHIANPYHNFYHAVDVLQSVYYTLRQAGLLQQPQSTSPSHLRHLLTPMDIFALLLICIGHDLGHPGVTNSFMINTSTSLSLLYNDISVLESYHAMLLYRLIKKYWLDQLDRQHEVGFRKRVIQGILATDMALHKDYMAKITQLGLVFRQESTQQQLTTIDEDEQRTVMFAAIIKCADISNIARPFSVAKLWANRLVEELHGQDKLETELGLSSCLDAFGLPLDEDRHLPLALFQQQFITKIGVQLFEATSDLVPGNLYVKSIPEEG